MARKFRWWFHDYRPRFRLQDQCRRYDHRQQDDVAGTTGAYALGLSSLSVNLQYFFKAYAIQRRRHDLVLRTQLLDIGQHPSAPTVNNPTTSSLDVTLGSGDGNPAGTTYAIQETTTVNSFKRMAR